MVILCYNKLAHTSFIPSTFFVSIHNCCMSVVCVRELTVQNRIAKERYIHTSIVCWVNAEGKLAISPLIGVSGYLLIIFPGTSLRQHKRQRLSPDTNPFSPMSILYPFPLLFSLPADLNAYLYSYPHALCLILLVSISLCLSPPPYFSPLSPSKFVALFSFSFSV